jgi:hypothetical protein
MIGFGSRSGLTCSASPPSSRHLCPSSDCILRRCTVQARSPNTAIALQDSVPLQYRGSLGEEGGCTDSGRTLVEQLWRFGFGLARCIQRRSSCSGDEQRHAIVFGEGFQRRSCVWVCFLGEANSNPTPSVGKQLEEEARECQVEGCLGPRRQRW